MNVSRILAVRDTIAPPDNRRLLVEANLSGYAAALLAQWCCGDSIDWQELVAIATAAGMRYPRTIALEAAEFGYGVQLAAVTIAYETGGRSDAITAFDAIHLSEDVPAPVRAAIALHIARYNRFAGRYDTVRRRLEELGRFCEDQRLPAYIVHIQRECELLENADDAFNAYAMRVSLSQAVAALDRCEPYAAADIVASVLFRERGSPEAGSLADRVFRAIDWTARALPFFVMVSAYCEEPLRSEALERLRTLSRHADTGMPAAYAQLAHAYVARSTGRNDDARTYAESAARIFSSFGDTARAHTALDFILALSPSASGGVSSGEHPLTKRQQQIAELIRDGLSNRQIAAKLHISEHTVERHLTNIFVRLRLKSRFQLAQTDALR